MKEKRLCPKERRYGGWEGYQCAAYAASRGHSIFNIEKGHVGIGPLGTQKGDLVCVLHGGDVLYVLRPVEDHFELIGESYVHGAMDGEFVVNEERWPTRSFDIH